MNTSATRTSFCTFVAALAAAMLLHRLGTGALAAPPVRDVGAFAQWAEANGTVGASMAALRLVAFVAAIYLGVIAAMSALVALHPSAPFAALLRNVTPLALRRALGLGTIAALSVTASMSGVAHAETAHAETAHAETAHAEDVPVMVHVGAVAPTTTSQPRPAPPTLVQVEPAVSVTPAPSAPTPAIWSVERGQHLWGIAAATVHARGGTDAQIVTYWRALIDANHDRFVVPGEPDLIFPGQELVLPPGP